MDDYNNNADEDDVRTQEIRRLATVEFDDVHGCHCQSSPVHLVLRSASP